jgi:hypothetical protein
MNQENAVTPSVMAQTEPVTTEVPATVLKKPKNIIHKNSKVKIHHKMSNKSRKINYQKNK